MLVLVALGTLPLVSVLDAQDTSRLALTQSIVERGKVDIDPYWQLTIDRGVRERALVLGQGARRVAAAVPVVAARPRGRRAAGSRSGCAAWPLWVIRRLERRARAARAHVPRRPRRRGPRRRHRARVTAATLAVGTMAGSLGPTVFGAPAGRARPLRRADRRLARARPATGSGSGLLAGVGVLFEYPAGLAALVLLDLRRRCAAGGAPPAWSSPARVPPALVLGAYDWLAFGAPWRLSYRYTSNVFTAQQQQNLFGVGLPTGHGIWTLLLDGHGLLLVSPVLALAAAGPRAVPAPPAPRGRRRDRDRARVRGLHRRLLPAERRPLAGPALRHRGAAVPAPRPAVRARALAARHARRSPRCSIGRRALRRAHLVGREPARVPRLAGDGLVAARALARGRAASLLLACGAAAGLVAVAPAGCVRGRWYLPRSA